MISFLDGPAAGESLALHRAPKLLRVVRTRKGEWDALDQLDDEPKPSEQIFVYRRRDDLPISRLHLLCGRGRNSGSGWYWTASYSVLEVQPGEHDTRTTAAWQAWATQHAEEK